MIMLSPSVASSVAAAGAAVDEVAAARTTAMAVHVQEELHQPLYHSNGSGNSNGSATGEGGGDIPNDPGKMFIGGLSWQTTPESIREYFSMFGELAEVMVMKDPATRRSRGFGFITFSDPAAVEKVLNYPVHQLDGKMVEPKVAVPRKTNPKLVMRTKKIFVGGISATTSLEDVRAYFEQFSKVRDAMLAYDKMTNRHRGFGFVTFDNDEVVDKICEIHFHEINGKMVESKKALPKEPRYGYGNCYGFGGQSPMYPGFGGPFNQQPNQNQKPLPNFGYSTKSYPNTSPNMYVNGSMDRSSHSDSFYSQSTSPGQSQFRDQSSKSFPMQYRASNRNGAPQLEMYGERSHHQAPQQQQQPAYLLGGVNVGSSKSNHHLEEFPPLNNNNINDGMK